jgi:hypothetical protein
MLLDNTLSSKPCMMQAALLCGGLCACEMCGLSSKRAASCLLYPGFTHGGFTHGDSVEHTARLEQEH